LFLVQFGGGTSLAPLAIQDPDRDIRGPREGGVDHEPERSDREAGAGRPVQLDEEGRGR